MNIETSDPDLLYSAAAGDEAAFRALVDRRAPGLLQVAVALCRGNRSDAEDICQDTFIAACRSLRSYRGTGSVKGWLTRILVRRAGRFWKKQKRHRDTFSLEDAGGAGSVIANGGAVTPLTSKGSLATPAMAVDQRLDLLEAIATLPPEFRDTIVLREVEGMSYQEIADALQVPRGTVESRIYRGRMALRKRLTGYDVAVAGRIIREQK